MSNLPDHPSSEIGHVLLRKREGLFAPREGLEELACEYATVVSVLLLGCILRSRCQTPLWGRIREEPTSNVQSTQPSKSKGFFFLFRCSASMYARRCCREGHQRNSMSMEASERTLYTVLRSMFMLSYDSILFFLKLIAAHVQCELLWLTGIRMMSLEKRSNYAEVREVLWFSEGSNAPSSSTSRAFPSRTHRS